MRKGGPATCPRNQTLTRQRPPRDLVVQALANMYAARPPLPQGGGAPGPSGSGSGSQEEAAGAAAGAADAAGGVAATDLQQGARANDAGLRRDGGATDPVGKPPVGATSPGGTGTAAASETTGAAATSSLSPDSNDPRAAAYEFVVKNVSGRASGDPYVEPLPGSTASTAHSSSSSAVGATDVV